MNSEHLHRVESVRARRRYACADGALTVLHEAKEARDTAPAFLRLKHPREHKDAKATLRYEEILFLQRYAHRQVCLSTKAKGTSDFRSCLPCMRDCHERDCLPDKAGTTFDGVIESLMAQSAQSCQWIAILLLCRVNG